MESRPGVRLPFKAPARDPVHRSTPVACGVGDGAGRAEFKGLATRARIPFQGGSGHGLTVTVERAGSAEALPAVEFGIKDLLSEESDPEAGGPENGERDQDDHGNVFLFHVSNLRWS